MKIDITAPTGDLSTDFFESGNLQLYRRLFLRGLTREVAIGVHDFERVKPQRIIFDIDLYVLLTACTPRSDLIDEVVDYDFVRDVVSELTQREHIDLQETLCDALLSKLLAHPQVSAARVSTRKPDVYGDCDSVGVEVFRVNSNRGSEPSR